MNISEVIFSINNCQKLFTNLNHIFKPDFVLIHWFLNLITTELLCNINRLYLTDHSDFISAFLNWLFQLRSTFSYYGFIVVLHDSIKWISFHAQRWVAREVFNIIVIWINDFFSRNSNLDYWMCSNDYSQTRCLGTTVQIDLRSLKLWLQFLF